METNTEKLFDRNGVAIEAGDTACVLDIFTGTVTVKHGALGIDTKDTEIDYDSLEKKVEQATLDSGTFLGAFTFVSLHELAYNFAEDNHFSFIEITEKKLPCDTMSTRFCNCANCENLESVNSSLPICKKRHRIMRPSLVLRGFTRKERLDAVFGARSCIDFKPIAGERET